MKKYTRGFTLIELLVVIAIIGILASVILVSLNSARKKANDTRIISDVNQIRTQLEQDYNATNSYGNTGPVGDLGVNSFATTAGSSTNINTVMADVGSNSGTVTIVTNGALPITAYGIWGKLPSQTTTTYFCINSTGNTKQSTTATPQVTCI